MLEVAGGILLAIFVVIVGFLLFAFIAGGGLGLIFRVLAALVLLAIFASHLVGGGG